MPKHSDTFLRISFVVIGLALMLSARVSFDSVRHRLDSYSSRGRAEKYTPQLHARVAQAVQLTGLGVIAAGVAASLLSKALSAAVCELKVDAASLRQSVRNAVPTWQHTTIVLLIMLAGLALRLKYIGSPVRYDEAETYLSAVMPPWFVTISSYYAPNNHILHSLLAKLSCSLFGGAPWALRLPALCAGMALIPATYITTCALAGSNVSPRLRHLAAIVATLLVAGSAPLTEHSVNARGYSLVGLCWMISVVLATCCQNTNNLAAWIGLSIAFACGLWTIPTMLFAIVGINVWMILNRLAPTAGHKRTMTMRRLIACNVLAGALTVALYLPVFVIDGPATVFGNRWVSPQPLSVVIHRQWAVVEAVWRVSQEGLPPELRYLLLGAAGIGLFSFGRCGGPGVPLWFVGTLVVLGMALIQRVVPLARVFLFLLPTYFAETALVLVTLAPRSLLSGAAGMSAGPVSFASCRNILFKVLTFSSFSAAIVWIAAFARWDEFIIDPDQTGDADLVASYLQSRVRDGDLIVSTVPINAPLEYYFLRMGLPRQLLVRRQPSPMAAGRMFVVVHPGKSQTVESVLRAELPNSELPSVADFKRIAEFPNAAIYANAAGTVARRVHEERQCLTGLR